VVALLGFVAATMANLLHGGDRKSENFKASFEALKEIGRVRSARTVERAASMMRRPPYPCFGL